MVALVLYSTQVSNYKIIPPELRCHKQMIIPLTSLSLFRSQFYTGQTWIGLVIKATYSFFGVEHNDKNLTASATAQTQSGQRQVQGEA